MASWNDRSWPLRRWLVDRLVGQHAYSRNILTPPVWLYRRDWVAGGKRHFEFEYAPQPFDQERS